MSRALHAALGSLGSGSSAWDPRCDRLLCGSRPNEARQTRRSKRPRLTARFEWHFLPSRHAGTDGASTVDLIDHGSDGRTVEKWWKRKQRRVVVEFSGVPSGQALSGPLKVSFPSPSAAVTACVDRARGPRADAACVGYKQVSVAGGKVSYELFNALKAGAASAAGTEHAFSTSQFTATEHNGVLVKCRCDSKQERAASEPTDVQQVRAESWKHLSFKVLCRTQVSILAAQLRICHGA